MVGQYSQAIAVLLFCTSVIVLVNSYILKYFLKISFRKALWNYVKMVSIGFFYLMIAIVPLAGLAFLMKLLTPNFFGTYQVMNELFSIQGIPAILHQGLSKDQLIWAPVIVSIELIKMYASYYISCYVYVHHVDASVDKSSLKKAIISMFVSGVVSGMIVFFITS